MPMNNDVRASHFKPCASAEHKTRGADSNLRGKTTAFDALSLYYQRNIETCD